MARRNAGGAPQMLRVLCNAFFTLLRPAIIVVRPLRHCRRLVINFAIYRMVTRLYERVADAWHHQSAMLAFFSLNRLSPKIRLAQDYV